MLTVLPVLVSTSAKNGAMITEAVPINPNGVYEERYVPNVMLPLVLT